ncbi:hypothetical protein HETIRDRAFT_440275 [Heterobasidion irregulare TC 32-1]|uniref:Phosphoribulokinase/uridine kinase domain-containing protein n=1 Tax=Heterobasidion irregulare (strain TC 32-1) TaxID=747525 RepID=W4K5E7_HETIT|nr:uncharacterized protein HETIRDRAFT_440275 [Heterobasidion irregulare TC 32-1]ETW80261.1 hypothetical protein HETIRDRAFT_440275 [Heterobasidion irregulare TC 32-1]
MGGSNKAPAPTPSPIPIPTEPRDGSLPNELAAEAARTRVVLVGIGGATCSGKTTLAKHLRRLLPNSFIIHQDDFAPPQSTLPIHPKLNVQDWDSAPTAIDWPRMRTFMRTVKQAARIPAEHQSHDHLNEQKVIPVPPEVFERWRSEIQSLQRSVEVEKGERIVWGLVDGFLLYWDEEVVSRLDARFFLRVPHEVLRQRREERSGYHTAENTFWKDPPGYFEDLVWPAYVEAHRKMFENDDPENGAPRMEGLTLIEPLELGMGEIVERCCGVLKGVLDTAAHDAK